LKILKLLQLGSYIFLAFVWVVGWEQVTAAFMWVSFQEGKNWAPKVLYLRYATVFGREIYFVLVEGGTSKPHDKDVTTGMGE
jgi:hypothetical protein